MSRTTRSSRAIGHLVPAALSVAALVGFVAGLGTGIATIVKWVNAPTAADAINAVSPWGGLALLLLTMYAYATQQPADPEFGRVAPVTTLTVCIVGLLAIGGIDSFRVFGLVAVVALPITGALSYAAHRQSLFKDCPDCAEAVRRDARVCRFCGWRFVRGIDMAP
jgi:hypothetical protein